MKKSISMLLMATMCISMVGCGQSSKGSGKAPEIQISEIRESETKNNVSTKEAKDIQSSEKVAVIDEKLLELLKDNKDTIINEITGEDINATIENTDNGIKISTQTSDQRDNIVEIMNGYTKDIISECTKNSPAVHVNYDIKNGFLDIYCTEEDIKAVNELVNKATGYMALGQKISDNSAEWGISVMVSDAVTKKSVTRGMVSIETDFELSENDWGNIDDSTDLPMN